jgi:NAD(P)-dependent dehydrogenase (short-subunit alcohol dehydrogenase family)
MNEETRPTFSLNGKVVVVTGGYGILGKSFCKAIALAGGSVVILGRDERKGEAAIRDIEDSGGTAFFSRADVMDEPDLILAKETILKKFGKIDGLVNAAGGNVPEAVLQPEADIFSLNMQGMKKALDLNVWGTLLPTQIFGSALMLQPTSSIVNISSVSTVRPLTKVLGYSMAKAAIDAYTKWFAVEVANRHGDAIRVNALVPGFFLTDQNRTLLTQPDGSLTPRGQSIIKQTPFRRFGIPQELNGALVWLLSDASKFVTGTMVRVDGGFMSSSGV